MHFLGDCIFNKIWPWKKKVKLYSMTLVSVHQFVPSQKPQQFTPVLKVFELNYNNLHVCKNAIIKR